LTVAAYSNLPNAKPSPASCRCTVNSSCTLLLCCHLLVNRVCRQKWKWHILLLLLLLLLLLNLILLLLLSQ
jgi:hypothetical protein